MRRSQLTEEQITGIGQEHEAGAATCWTLKMSTALGNVASTWLVRFSTTGAGHFEHAHAWNIPSVI